ncbi:MAG: hypothetical protein V1779_10215 [bacterium]
MYMAFFSKANCSLFAIVFVITSFFSDTLAASDNSDANYNVKNIAGLSYSITQIDNKMVNFIELRDQICYEINDFPIIPYFEPNLFIGLSKEKPNLFYTVLFGMRKNFLVRRGLLFSMDLGSGIAAGLNDKDNAGVIGRIGFDIEYKNIILRCVDLSFVSGFAFKGTASIGLSYKF